MKKPTRLIIRSMSVLFLITTFLPATAAWSAPGDKKQPLLDSADKSVLERGEVKDVDKGKISVKKKVVKHAGTAAAVGVAGKKATSKIKPDIKKTEK